ncbi:hypothetical protein B7463_g1983, partial [Scytalidium lignicola]
MATDIVTCFCLQCNTELGRFRNSWTRVGNTYYTAEYTINDNGFDPTGEVRPAGAASQIEHRLIPDGGRNQLILRLSNMSVISELSGAKADIKVIKALPLAVSNGDAVAGPPKASSLQNMLPSSRLANISDSVKTPDASLRGHDGENSQLNLMRFKVWAEDAITSQQKDIDRISGAVDRIEREMRSLKEMMYEIRDDVVASKQSQVPKDDSTSLRAELEVLRDEISISAQRPMAAAENDRTFVRETAAEVEELKRELQKLKRSLQSFIVPARNSRPPVVEPAMTSMPSHQHNEGPTWKNGTIDKPVLNDRNSITDRDINQSNSPTEMSPQPARQPSDEGYGTARGEMNRSRSSGKPRWVYIGPRDAPSLKIVLPCFGIKYNNTKIVDAVNRLELHVRRTGQEDTPYGREYGKIMSPGDEIPTIPLSPSGTSRKRSHNYLEAGRDVETASSSKKPMWKPGTPGAGQHQYITETTSEPRKQILSLLGGHNADHAHTETYVEKPVFEKRIIGDREVKLKTRPGWRRNSDGVLLTPNGKIDGRSLKFLGKPAANRMRKDHLRKQDSVIASIESGPKNDHEDGSFSRDSSLGESGMLEHSEEVRMREEEQIKEAEAKRREELRAREQLVAQTLESEVER